jgi:NADPH2:quinone reductase
MSGLELVPGRRVIVDAYGETPLDALLHHLRLEEQPAPDPNRLGDEDVIVAIRSAAVGWVDLLMTSGQYQHMAEPPYTPGLEFSGEIAWVGRHITDLAVGDRVLVDPFLVGPRTSGPYREWGGFASWAVAPAKAIHRLPESLAFDQAANLLGNYETAYHCLVARGRLAKGEHVLILGSSGSTGLAAVHVAKRVGATVIATGRSPDKLAIVAKEGADHVIVTDDGEGGVRRFRDEVKALTDGRGVDVVYDPVGGDLSLEALRCVKFGARFLIVGWASTPFVAKGKGGRGAPNANQLPTNLIMMKGLDVLGSPTVIGTKNDPSLRPPRLEAIWRWVDEGLRPRVAQSFPLEDVVEAMRAKWHSRFVGGCVVHP